jgi:hypothetical protein
MVNGLTREAAPSLVTVHALPSGEPFAVVIGDSAKARMSVSADGSAVTVTLRLPGVMPCSVIFPEFVAVQAFGPDFVEMFAESRGPDADRDGDG